MSSSNSPCAACKCLRRKCTQECVFAPYFPPDNPQKFANVHKVFGASNVAKLLSELSTPQRDDAVKSLAYEAEARLRDPVYGCVGLISILQHKLKQIQNELDNAKKELATYIGPQAMLPILQPMGMIPQQQMGNSSTSMFPYNNMAGPMMGVPTRPSHGGPFVIHDAQQNHHPPPQQQQQHIFDAQQLVEATAREQEMLRIYEQQQQQLLRFNGGFDMGSVSGGGFNHMSSGSGAVAALSPSLALGTFDNPYHQLQPQQAEHPHHHQRHLQLLLAPRQQQAQQQAPQSQQPQQQQNSESEEGQSGGPA